MAVARQEHGNHMSTPWQAHGKFMAHAWQEHSNMPEHGKSMARALQEHGKHMAEHGKSMAKGWQGQGKRIAPSRQEQRDRVLPHGPGVRRSPTALRRCQGRSIALAYASAIMLGGKGRGTEPDGRALAAADQSTKFCAISKALPT